MGSFIDLKITEQELANHGMTSLPGTKWTNQAAMLKAKLDEDGTFVAGRLGQALDALEDTTAAASVGAAPFGRYTATNIQGLIEESAVDLQGKIDDVVAGVLPSDAVTTEKIRNGAVTAEKIATGVIPDKATEAEALVGTDDTKYLTPSKLVTGLKKIYNVGDVKFTGKTDLDSTWALCNGGRISNADYPELFSTVKKSPDGRWTQYAYPLHGISTSVNSAFAGQYSMSTINVCRFIGDYIIMCGVVYFDAASGSSADRSYPGIAYKHKDASEFTISISQVLNSAVVNESIVDVVYANNKWRIISSAGKIHTNNANSLEASFDWATGTMYWSTGSAISGLASGLASMTFISPNYIVLGKDASSNNKLFSSTDASSWSSTSLSGLANAELGSIRLNGSTYEILGFSSTSAPIRLTSTNVNTGWNLTTAPITLATGSYNANSLRFINGLYSMIYIDTKTTGVLTTRSSSDFVSWPSAATFPTIVSASYPPSGLIFYNGWYIVPLVGGIAYSKSLSSDWVFRSVRTLNWSPNTLNGTAPFLMETDGDVVFYTTRDGGYFLLFPTLPIIDAMDVYAYMKVKSDT